MESLLVPVIKLLMENPEWAIFITMLDILLISLIWKFTLAKMNKKLSIMYSEFTKHAEESVARGTQIETTKDSVMELKGLIAGMSNHQGVK